jgi:hypothetical protein
MQTLPSLSFAKIVNLGLHLPLQGLLPTLFFTSLCRDCQALFFTFCRDLVLRKQFWCLHSSSAEILHLRKQIWLFCDNLQIWSMMR